MSPAEFANGGGGGLRTEGTGITATYPYQFNMKDINMMNNFFKLNDKNKKVIYDFIEMLSEEPDLDAQLRISNRDKYP